MLTQKFDLNQNSYLNSLRTNNNNFESLSYNSLQLNNNEEIHIDFPSSTNVNCRNFDLYEIINT